MLPVHRIGDEPQQTVEGGAGLQAQFRVRFRQRFRLRPQLPGAIGGYARLLRRTGRFAVAVQRRHPLDVFGGEDSPERRRREILEPLDPFQGGRRRPVYGRRKEGACARHSECLRHERRTKGSVIVDPIQEAGGEDGSNCPGDRVVTADLVLHQPRGCPRHVGIRPAQ